MIVALVQNYSAGVDRFGHRAVIFAHGCVQCPEFFQHRRVRLGEVDGHARTLQPYRQSTKHGDTAGIHPVHRSHIEDDAVDFLAFMLPDQIEDSILDVFGVAKIDGAIDPDPQHGQGDDLHIVPVDRAKRRAAIVTADLITRGTEENHRK